MSSSLFRCNFMIIRKLYITILVSKHSNVILSVLSMMKFYYKTENVCHTQFVVVVFCQSHLDLFFISEAFFCWYVQSVSLQLLSVIAECNIKGAIWNILVSSLPTRLQIFLRACDKNVFKLCQNCFIIFLTD